MKLYKLALVILLITLQSCQSNEIYFDTDEQQICSANSKELWHIDIVSEDAQEYYNIDWYCPEKKPPIKLSLSSIPSCYDIKVGAVSSINSKQFKLKPNTIYVISRSGGDASGHSIMVTTDSTGRVAKELDEVPKL